MPNIKTTRGGARVGAGRKPAKFPAKLKKLRATPKEWAEFMSFLANDSRKDFIILLDALRSDVESLRRRDK